MKNYLDEGKCFKCGEIGHVKANCPLNAPKPPPSSSAVPDVQGNTTKEGQERVLLKAWGSLNNQRVLILFDPGSTDNFISLETADDLQIQPNRLGTPIQASAAFKGKDTNSTPIIGKLNLKIDSYKDSESFLMAPLEGCDVIWECLGISRCIPSQIMFRKL